MEDIHQSGENEAAKPVNKETQSQFSVGKSYGLSNNPRKIGEYKQKMEDICAIVNEANEKELRIFNSAIDALWTDFQSMHKKVLDAHQQILLKLGEAMDVIKKHKLNESENNPDIKQMHTEVLKLAFHTFKQNMNVVTVHEQVLAGRIDETAKQMKPSFERLANRHNELVQKLKAEHIDISEYERGYLYGDALRIALSETKI